MGKIFFGCLLSALIYLGGVTATETAFSESNYESIELSNGIKVILQKNSSTPGQLKIGLFGAGGKNLLKEEEYDTAYFAPLIQICSGTTSFPEGEFIKYLQEKGIAMSYDIQPNMRYLSIKGRAEQGKEMLEVLASFFTQKQFSQKVYEDLRGDFIECDGGEEEEDCLYNWFSAQAPKILHSGDSFYENPSYKQVHFEQLEECAYKLFGDPKEFVFVMMGDFDFEKAKEWLEASIAPLQGVNIDKQRVSPGGMLPIQVKECFVFKGIDDPLLIIAYGRDEEFFTSLIEAFYQTQALALLLEKRIEENDDFCEDEVYTATVSVAIPFFPEMQELNTYITFVSTREEALKSQKIAVEEARKIAIEGFTKEEVAEVKEKIKEWMQEGVHHNKGLFLIHEMAFFAGVSPDEVLSQMEEWVTPESLQALAKHLFENRPYIKMCLIAKE